MQLFFCNHICTVQILNDDVANEIKPLKYDRTLVIYEHNDRSIVEN